MSNLHKIKPYEVSQTNKKRHSKLVTWKSVDVQQLLDAEPCTCFLFLSLVTVSESVACLILHKCIKGPLIITGKDQSSRYIYTLNNIAELCKTLIFKLESPDSWGMGMLSATKNDGKTTVVSHITGSYWKLYGYGIYGYMVTGS